MATVAKLRFYRTSNGVRKLYTSRNYYGWVGRRHVSLSQVKDVAERRLAEMIQEAERRKHGQIDRFAEHRNTPLAAHIAKFREHLEAKGNDAKYIGEAIRNLHLATAGGHFLRDVTADRLNSFLRDLADKGRSPATLNTYLTAAKNFCQWCVRTSRLPDNPLAHLSKRNEEVDVRRERRALTKEECGQFIAATERSQTAYRRLSGRDRSMLYCVAMATGLRRGELRRLSTRSLSLDADVPLITVEAAYSKRRRRDEQPIPLWLAERLKAWLADRPSVGAVPLWPGSWWRRAAEMIRMDLEAAGIAYVDVDGRVFDFHAQRHHFTTSLFEADVHPRTAQQLARHSTIELTMQRYTHVSLRNVAAAVASIPEPPSANEGQQLATGTDDLPLRAGCATRVHSRAKLAVDDPGREASQEREEQSKPLQLQGFT